MKTYNYLKQFFEDFCPIANLVGINKLVLDQWINYPSRINVQVEIAEFLTAGEVRLISDWAGLTFWITTYRDRLSLEFDIELKCDRLRFQRMVF